VRGRAGALEKLSVFYLSEGDTLAAAESLSRAFDARPNPLYLGAAGSHYVTARRYGRAERQFERLVAARPLDVEANLSLGILHAIRGDMEGARSYLLVAYGDTSLSLPEPTIDSKSDWVDMPKGPEREALITGRIEKRYEASGIFVKGDEAARRGLLQVAERRYRAALDTYPNWGRMQYEAHLHLGTIYAMQGRFREAAYELLLGLDSYGDYKLCTFIVNGIGYGPARPRAISTHLPPSAE
jgi:tetratricopeptide (TPR) repeat protein